MNDEWNDSDLEHEIEQALAVNPSPAFLPRVRERIAKESPRSFSLWWTFGSAGTVAATFVLAFFISGRARTERPPAVATPAPAAASTPAVVPSSVLVVAQLQKASRKPQAESEFFTGRTEAKAFQHLLQASNEGHIDLPEWIDGRDAAMEIRPLSEIKLEPLAPLEPILVEPLNPQAREGTNP